MGAMIGTHLVRALARPLTLAVSMLMAFAGMTTLAQGGSPPTFIQQLGGPDHAQIYPSGLETSPDGSLIVADTGNDQIEKFKADGTPLWRVGGYGNGVNQFYEPRDVGVDSSGNVYVVDSRNNRVVKLDTNGNWVMSWVAPVGDNFSNPLGITVSNDLVYLTDTGKNEVRVFDSSGNPLKVVKGGTLGTQCYFTGPRDAAADSAGNVYVVAYAQNRIVKFDSSGNCLIGWGGTGTTNGKFKAPYGVAIAVDPVFGAEEVYVADANNNRVQEFTESGVYLTQLGMPGTGPGQFSFMRRVAVAKDGSGDVWGADFWAWRVERFARTPTGYTYAQTIGTPLPAATDTAVFHEPRGISFEADGTVDVMDTVHHRFVRMTPQGHILNMCGTRGSGLDQYNWPRGIGVDPVTGNIWAVDTKDQRIEIIQPSCAGVTKFGTPGSGTGQFNWPYSIAIRASDGTAWIADTWNHRVVVYNIASRTQVASFGGKGGGIGRFLFPSGIAIDPINGHVLVADANNNRIVELSDSGGGSGITWVRIYNPGLLGPQGVAADSKGHIIVADTGHNQVMIINPDGTLATKFTASDGFFAPQIIAVDSSDQIYVADTYNDRVMKYGPFT
jgi:DNA-binding beta-propeller fold protein YncE